MALNYAILALLTDCPSSGYELNKLFEESIGCFWKATHQQIYRELGKLENLEWVSAQVILQTGRPDKKQYSITELGQHELVQWLAKPSDMTPVKEEILIKLFVGDLAAPEIMRQQIEQHRQQYAERQAFYRAIEAKFFPTVQNLSRQETFRYLTLRCGMLYANGWLNWCDEALQKIDDLERES